MPGNILKTVVMCKLLASHRGYVAINVISFVLIFGVLGATGIYLMVTTTEENERIEDKKAEIAAEQEKIRMRYEETDQRPTAQTTLERELELLQADPSNYTPVYTGGAILIGLAFLAYAVTFAALRFYRRRVCKVVNALTDKVLAL